MESALEQRMLRIEAMLRALLEMERPQITFAEVKQMLGVDSDGAARNWLLANKIKRLSRGRYRRVEVIAAATTHQKRAA